MTSENFFALLPEIVLAAVAIGIYMVGAFVGSPRLWRWIAMAALALAGIALWTGGGEPPQTVVADPLAVYGRWFSLAAGIILLLMAWRPVSTSEAPEYCGTLLLLITGLVLASAAGDLILVFVGLELVSIPTYILLYLGRRDIRSQESTAKYFYLSILSSATLLYGLSFLYGLAGRTDLGLIHARLVWARGEFRDPGAGRAGLDPGRVGIPHCRRSISLLCSRCVPGYHARQCGPPGRRAQDCRSDRSHSPDQGGAARHRVVCVDCRACPGDPHHDFGQRDGSLAEKPAAIVGVFVDCPGGIHADWPGRLPRLAARRTGSMGWNQWFALVPGRLFRGHSWHVRRIGGLGSRRPAGCHPG